MQETKRCLKCGVDKSVDKFWLRGDSVNRLRSHCISCCVAASTKRRKENPQKDRQHQKAARLRRKQWYFDVKRQHKCAVCPEDNPVCLDFHHKDPKRKLFDISKHGNMPKDKILAEIAKCTCLCANCHRKLTHERCYQDFN